MEGREAVTMEGKTRIKWDLGSSNDAQRTRVERVTAGASDQTEALRVRLIAATVEVLAEGSHPRLGQTRDMRAAA